jgi:hypothetical protein
MSYCKSYMNVIPGIRLFQITIDDSRLDDDIRVVSKGEDLDREKYLLVDFFSWMRGLHSGRSRTSSDVLEMFMNSDDAFQAIDLLTELYAPL